MDFKDYESIVAKKLQQLRQQQEQVEAAFENIEIDSENAVLLDSRLKSITENLKTIEAIALIMIRQNDALTLLKEELIAEKNRNNCLSEINARLYTRHNAARAVAALHQSKWDELEKQTDNWLKNELLKL